MLVLLQSLFNEFQLSLQLKSSLYVVKDSILFQPYCCYVNILLFYFHLHCYLNLEVDIIIPVSLFIDVYVSMNSIHNFLFPV